MVAIVACKVKRCIAVCSIRRCKLPMVHRATHQAIWCTGTLYYYTFPVSGAHRMPQGPCPVAANSPRRPGPHADKRGGYRAAEYMRAQPLLHTVGYSLITYGYSPITYGYSPRTPGPHADERGGYRAADYMRAQPLLHTVGYSLITYGDSPITYGYKPPHAWHAADERDGVGRRRSHARLSRPRRVRY